MRKPCCSPSPRAWRRWRAGPWSGATDEETWRVASEAARAAEKVSEGARFGDRASTVARTCCFVAGTLVQTADGLRRIETIKVGDRVLSRDAGTGETGLKPVTSLVRRHNREIWRLTLSVASGADGKAVSAFFETTDEIGRAHV